MTPVFRLDSVSPPLAESFRNAPSAKRHQAALAACELATSSTGLAGEEVVTALEALRRGARSDAALREKLEALAARLDDEYFRLNEEEDDARTAEALRFFSKARAASALASALTDDSAQLHEALYEAITAVDDPGDIIRSAGRALR